MRGDISSLKSKLQDLSYLHSSRRVFHVWCQAHRLQLALAEPFLSNSIGFIEVVLKQLATFYHTGHKRWLHLDNLCKELNVHNYRFSSVFKVRWIASEQEAVLKLIKGWGPVVKALNQLAQGNDESTDPFNTKLKAKSIEEKLKGKSFLTYLHWLADLLKLIADTSKSLQSNKITIIKQESLILSLIRSLEILKTENGLQLTKFLSQCKTTSNSVRVANLEELEQAKEIFYEHIGRTAESSYPTVLYDDSHNRYSSRNMPHLSDTRVPLIDSIIAELRRYFITSEFSLFSVFDPANIPKDPAQIPFYGIEKLMEISKLAFGDTDPDSDQWIHDWHNLLNKIIISNGKDYAKFACSDYKEFWLANLKNSALPWNDKMKFAIKMILSIPLSSAQAERGFSMMNIVKNKLKNRMGPITLEHIMELKINGPPLESFDAMKYAKHWVEDDSHMKSDDPAKIRKKWTKRRLNLDNLQDDAVEDVYINEEQMDVDNLDENYDNWEDIEFEDGNI
jgi:hypothetical protein